MDRVMKGLLVSAVILVASTPLRAAHTTTIVGRVADVREEGSSANRREDARPQTLVINARGREVSMGLSPKTHYLRWVTRPPWQQSARADASFLRPGRLVSVEVGDNDQYPVARMVRIAIP